VAHYRLRHAWGLAAVAAVVAAAIGLHAVGSAPTASPRSAASHANLRPASAAKKPADHHYRGLVGSRTPFEGAIYIADEQGNRIIKVNAARQVLWTAHVPMPDDANPMPNGGPIIVNSDANQVVYAVSPTTGKILWTYGHMGHYGSAPGYLYIPEDSYGMPGNRVLITDPGNERAVMINTTTQQIVWQYGHTGVESTQPGYLYWTNNAVPLYNESILITDGAAAGLPQQVLDVNLSGHILWHVTLPPAIHYPSDAMPVGPGLYALADYSNPAGLYVINRHGQIVWSYYVASGPGALNHASSINRLPNGNFLVSDDGNDRVVVIDPALHKIVWQYGTTGVPGMGPDQLMGNTDSKAVGEPLPPYVPWEGYQGPLPTRSRSGA
jgi:outer membrane protein assembly factor BamB